MNKNAAAVLIVGASSSIAEALAIEFAQLGYPLYLAARDRKALQHIASNLTLRYHAIVNTFYFDSSDNDSQTQLFQQIDHLKTPLGGIVIAYGMMGDQQQATEKFDIANEIFQHNLLSPISLIDHFVPELIEKKSGFVIALASVAGDRGRQSNYYYGAAKGGFALYLQGLRNRLSKSNVSVLTVKPGFIDTKMTYGNPDVFLAAAPHQTAKHIIRAWQTGKDCIYVPSWWRWIMLLIKLIPEKLFKKLSL